MRLVRLVRRQPVDLLLAVHHMPEVQARAGLEVARLEAAFEQQDRAAPVERAQPLGLGQVEQREAVGGAQRRKDALDAMPIGIGFDHGPQPGVGRGAPQSFEVVAQGRQVDGGEVSDAAWCDLSKAGRGRVSASCYKPATCGTNPRTEPDLPGRFRSATCDPYFPSLPSQTSMKRGFYTIMTAQFFSSLADNALFVVAVELLRSSHAPR